MDLPRWLLHFLIKKSATQKGTGINSENQQLVDELRKIITRKF